MNRRNQRSTSKPLAILTAIAVIAALYFGRVVLIPLAIALLLSLMLAPLVKRAERIGIGRVSSVVLVAAFSFCLILGVGWLVVIQARSVTDNLPTYRQNIVEKARAVRNSIEGVLGSASQAVKEIQKEIDRPDAAKGEIDVEEAGEPAPGELMSRGDPQRPLKADSDRKDSEEAVEEAVKVQVVSQSAGLAALTAAFTSLVRPLATAGIAFAFVVFILISREDLRDRVIRVFGGSRISFSTQAINDMGAAVSRYLLMLFVVNTANGAVIALCLWLIGLPSALLWGLLMAILRFIPLIGTMTAAALPIMLSLAIFDNWTYPLAVIALFIVVDAVSANILEPILYGAQVGASPVAVLAAATFWTWIWGPIGLLLAMPITVSLVVLGRYVRPLSFLTILLGNQPALPRELRFYQRLLSNDIDEARAILSAAIRQGETREEVYERIVAPSVVLAKEDRTGGFLDDIHEEFVRDAMVAILQTGEQAGDGDLASAPPVRSQPELDRLRIDCVPANGPFDEFLCQMLCQLLSEDGMPCRVVSQRLLAGELVESVHVERVDVLCIMAVGRDGEMRARYFVKRLRKRHRALPIVVGLWGSPDAGSTTAGCLWGATEKVEIALSFSQVRTAVDGLVTKALADIRAHGRADPQDTATATASRG